jgi:hypothetical protein
MLPSAGLLRFCDLPSADVDARLSRFLSRDVLAAVIGGDSAVRSTTLMTVRLGDGMALLCE